MHFVTSFDKDEARIWIFTILCVVRIDHIDWLLIRCLDMINEVLNGFEKRHTFTVLPFLADIRAMIHRWNSTSFVPLIPIRLPSRLDLTPSYKLLLNAMSDI